MKGFIEIKEDSYEDTIEHLYRIKMLTCKLIKMLSSHSELYDEEEEEEDVREEQHEPKSRTRSSKGRYIY